METITYLESCNKFFAPLDEIIEALENFEGLSGIDYNELKMLVDTNKELKFYIENFESHCNLM